MGHVIGIGTVWTRKKLLHGAGTTNPTFIGATAKRVFGKLKGKGPTPVPVENSGGPGTRDSHWRETVSHNELMSGFSAAAGKPRSRGTGRGLSELGCVGN